MKIFIINFKKSKRNHKIFKFTSYNIQTFFLTEKSIIKNYIILKTSQKI
jgi:hypothetical protein